MTDVQKTAPGARNNRWFLVGALAVAGLAFLLITAGGIGSNLVYYWGPTEVMAAGPKAVGATIRLGGLVAPGSVQQGQGSGLQFDVTDGKHKVHVKSQGVPPQMFRERIGVVVEGTMTRDGYFDCHRLMVSHSNEYRAPNDKDQAEKLDMRKLMRSLQEEDLKQLNGSPAPEMPHPASK
jgi:cytochrome c-type biogenesis protein CcmE